MISEKEREKYICAVARHLHCAKADKEACLASLEASIEEILQQDPQLSKEQLYEVIGEPKAVAKEFAEAIGEDKIRRHKRKRVALGVFLALLTVCIMVITYYFLMFDVVQPTVVVVHDVKGIFFNIN